MLPFLLSKLQPRIISDSNNKTLRQKKDTNRSMPNKTISNKSRRLLLIEDDDDLTQALQSLLQRKGFEVLKAQSVADGLANFLEFDPDIILSDLLLPDGSGIDILKHIRKISDNSRPYVFFMTGYTDLLERDLIRAGATKLFLKPLQIQEFVEAANELLNK